MSTEVLIAKPSFRSAFELILLIAVLAVLVWSGIRPKDRFTWYLEVAPVLIAIPLLILTRRRLRFTLLVYTLIAIHAVVLMVGGHYTYAEVPLGFRVQEYFGLARNHYDRLGHFAQGFVPAMVAREILVRRSPLRTGWWLPFVVVCFCLGFSALYERIEWWTAIATGEAAEAFLGTQGDEWDSQWDMMLALLGAIVALFTLSGLHDWQLRRSAGGMLPRRDFDGWLQPGTVGEPLRRWRDDRRQIPDRRQVGDRRQTGERRVERGPG